MFGESGIGQHWEPQYWSQQPSQAPYVKKTKAEHSELRRCNPTRPVKRWRTLVSAIPEPGSSKEGNETAITVQMGFDVQIGLGLGFPLRLKDLSYDNSIGYAKCRKSI